MKSCFQLKKLFATAILILLLTLPLLAQSPIWDANKITLVTKKIKPNIYGVFPKETFDDDPSKPKPTTGGFIVGEKCILVIESFLNAQLANELIKQIREVSNLPIKFLVNTSYHGDHSYGNYVFPASTAIIQHKATKEYVDKNFEADKKFMMQNFGQGRGIENVKARTGDILLDTKLDVDLGGVTVHIMTFGFGQTSGDLYLWEPLSKTLWVGNALVGPEPGIPWLLDGRHEEVLTTLKKVRNFLPEDAIIIPGHHRPMKKQEMDFSIAYLEALRDGIKKGIEQKMSLEKIVETLTLDAFNKGYPIYPWIHFQVNIPNTYKDLMAAKK